MCTQVQLNEIMNDMVKCYRSVFGENIVGIFLYGSYGSPVFLTRNGRGEYVILDMQEYDKLKASLALMAKLEEGEKSARENGWLSAEEVERALG